MGVMMMKITVNAGHCPGHDPGAVGLNGLYEADVNRDIMAHVAYYLRAILYEVLEVQENVLNDITRASNAFAADLFISIHCNTAEDLEVQGTETYYDMGSAESERLAACIQAQIVGEVGTVDRGVKQGNFYVLRLTDCPAILVETAFITNQKDEKLLADAPMRDRLGAAIARGVTDYLSMI